ncbi:MAG: SoxR reducing system RseC family protein [Spirochaetales bacterium]|nr:SoxR reducing system RseC family protein [Spirochaetales bacterium]
MTRKAIVREINGNRASLMALDEEELHHESQCGTKGGCGSSTCGCRVTGLPFEAQIPKDVQVIPGQTVMVTAPNAPAILAFFLILVLPALFAWSIHWLGTQYWENMSRGGGVMITIAAYVIPLLFALIKGKKKSNNLPIITGVTK